jgi:hypothetical protein
MEMIVRNVHEGLPKALHNLAIHGKLRGSRNGDVYEMQEPVTTVFLNPLERVIFYPERDANPFFHFFEALWMLAGRNDVAFVKQFVQRMEDFSDDGQTLNGAYGYRWKKHFNVRDDYADEVIANVDQLAIIAERLTANKEDRRCVLGMWDASHDLGRDSKDLPCNTTAMFLVRADGKLHMTVTNRSNDIIWGLYGANAVHFSYLLEYMAGRIGVPVGRQVHVSNNYHAYLNTFEPIAQLGEYTMEQWWSPYAHTQVEPYPIFKGTSWRVFDRDLELFFLATAEQGDIIPNIFLTPFFSEVVNPMWHAHRAFKVIPGEARYKQALELLEECRASDWRAACADWINVRYNKWKDAQHG